MRHGQRIIHFVSLTQKTRAQKLPGKYKSGIARIAYYFSGIIYQWSRKRKYSSSGVKSLVFPLHIFTQYL